MDNLTFLDTTANATSASRMRPVGREKAILRPSNSHNNFLASLDVSQQYPATQ